jgi:uncharacterized membrane protein
MTSHNPEHTRPERRREQSDSSDDGTAQDQVIRGVQLVFGTALLVRGLRQRSLRGTATALGGAWLVSRSMGGPSGLKQTLEERTTGGSERGEPQAPSPETAVRRSVTIGTSAEDCYEAWRDPETLSRVMGKVADVEPLDDDRSRWTVHGPYGQDVSWETHVVEDEPGELLRWETPTDAVLPNEGAVRFRAAPGGRGTTVTLLVSFDPPGGTLGNRALQQLDIVPEKLAVEALGRFKSLVETGEIPTLDRNPSARGQGDTV